MKYEAKIGTATHAIEVEALTGGRFRVQLPGLVDAVDAVEITPGAYSILLDGRSLEARVTDESSDQGLLVRCEGSDFRVQVKDPRAWRAGRHSALEASGPQRVLAPMPGKVVRVLAAAGEVVAAGQGLAVVEAMKMQNEIRAPKSGRIERVLVVEGQTVRSQEALLIIA